MRLLRILPVAALVLLLAGSATGYAYACATPVDISGRGTAADLISGQDDADTDAPSTLPLTPTIPRVRVGGQRTHRLFRSDLWRWPAHATLATLLQTGHCNASSTALQWLKAGAHVRTSAQAARAAAGLRQAIASASDPRALQARVCVLLDASSPDSPPLQAVQQAAALPCGASQRSAST